MMWSIIDHQVENEAMASDFQHLKAIKYRF